MAVPTFNDRKLAAEVRSLTLKKIKKLFELTDLSDKEKILHDALLIKLAGTVLPRLNELTGEDGGAMQVTLVNYADNSRPVPTETLPNTNPESV